MLTAAFVLLHVLVLVYWLGGDLGAFYASTYVSDPKRNPQARLAAAGILAGVDMAPRTALILAFPTGLTVAYTESLIDIPWGGLVMPAIWAAALGWLWLAWDIHLKHRPPGGAARRLDLAIRVAALAGLLALAGLMTAWPLFMRLKLVVLAGAIALGLALRRLLAPIGPAIATLASGEASEAADRTIARVLGASRPVVLLIWLLLLVAAALGIAKPA